MSKKLSIFLGLLILTVSGMIVGREKQRSIWLSIATDIENLEDNFTTSESAEELKDASIQFRFASLMTVEPLPTLLKRFSADYTVSSNLYKKIVVFTFIWKLKHSLSSRAP